MYLYIIVYGFTVIHITSTRLCYRGSVDKSFQIPRQISKSLVGLSRESVEATELFNLYRSIGEGILKISFRMEENERNNGFSYYAL